MYGTSQPGGLLLSPPAIVAVVAVLLNDHLFKGLWGNWWTGKLSDAAGLFLLPLAIMGITEVVRAASGHRRWNGSRNASLLAVIVAGVGLVLVKMVGPVGDAYALMIGWSRAAISVIPRGGIWAATPIEVIRDWTDLLVLPVLVLSWHMLTQRAQQAPHPSDTTVDAVP